jgi:hypothetical protein
MPNIPSLEMQNPSAIPAFLALSPQKSPTRFHEDPELADRLDGKPAQAVETTAEVAHRYVIEAPPLLSTEEWEKEYGTGETMQ